MHRGLFATLLVVSVAACTSSTTGKRVALDVTIASTPETKKPFVNALGWTVTLDTMLVATGALYFYDGETIFSWHAPARTPLERMGDFFVGTAWAHPGHYVAGTAKGELLGPSSADLLAGETLLGAGDGISGPMRSATFAFSSPAAGRFASVLGANVAIVQGTATKGAETRVFRAEVAASEIVNTTNTPIVEGCPFASGGDVEGNGVVTVTVDGKLWLDQVDFDGEPKSTDGKPVALPADGVARNGLVRGMKAGLSYGFAYRPK